MSALKKFFLICIFLLFVFCAEIFRLVYFSAVYSIYSPSSRYLLEDVRVFTPLAPSFNMGFLRIYDESDRKEYRSPLFRYDELEMRVYENQQVVGVYDLLLSKNASTFQIGLNYWCSHWLNFFVSNTPYHVVGDGRCEESLSSW